jgi:hypothetical protein
VIFSRLPIIAGLALLAVCSCRDRGGRFIDQGEIHYNIEYIKTAGTLSNDLKPKTLVVSFNKDKILFEITVPIANQGIINVVNPERNIYDTYINMLGVRYYYPGHEGETHPGFSSMEGVEIRKTDKRKTICGYSCKNAEATFPFDRTHIYDLWYTNDIRVRNSNGSNPFKEIDGVLMSFYYILGGSILKFDAETVYKKEIPEKAFERRHKFRPVSKNDLDKIITDMVNL